MIRIFFAFWALGCVFLPGTIVRGDSPGIDYQYSAILLNRDCQILIPPLDLAIQRELLRSTDYYNPTNILKFAEHLYDEGDYLRAAGEYQRYLFYAQKASDRTIYQIALCYRLGGNVEKSIRFFEKIVQEYPGSDLFAVASYQIGYSYFLMGQYGTSISYLKETLNQVESQTDRWKRQHLVGFNYLEQKRWDDAFRLFDSLVALPPDEHSKFVALTLKRYAEEGQHLPYKNPIFAASLSAILPGAGKIYTGRYGDGIYSFLIIFGTGWLAYRSFNRDGADSAKGWIFGTLSGLFYLGNIYGSAVSAQIYNRQKENELLAKISLELP